MFSNQWVNHFIDTFTNPPFIDGFRCALPILRGLRPGRYPVTPCQTVFLGRLLCPVLRHWRALDLHAFHRAWRLDTDSVAGYARRKLNRELLEHLLQPVLSGLFYWAPERSSQIMFFLL